VAVPGGIRKGIAIRAALIEAHIRVPIAVSGSFFVFAQIAEGPEVPAGMVKHAVQHQAHAALAQVFAQFCQVRPRSKPAIYFIIVGGVITMAARFEHGPKEERVCA